VELFIFSAENYNRYWYSIRCSLLIFASNWQLLEKAQKTEGEVQVQLNAPLFLNIFHCSCCLFRKVNGSGLAFGIRNQEKKNGAREKNENILCFEDLEVVFEVLQAAL
jgi:hypothetical protein